MSRTWIGLGSNLDDPPAQLRRALGGLEKLPETRLARASALYGSSPVGPSDQPDFINAVAELDTGLDPLALLDALQALEQRAGRQRGRRWGERTLDLDILLVDNQTLDHPRLTLPHPELARRGFVLVPLVEIAPGLQLPSGESVDALRAACDDTGVWYYGPARVEGETL